VRLLIPPEDLCDFSVKQALKQNAADENRRDAGVCHAGHIGSERLFTEEACAACGQPGLVNRTAAALQDQEKYRAAEKMRDEPKSG